MAHGADAWKHGWIFEGELPGTRVCLRQPSGKVAPRHDNQTGILILRKFLLLKDLFGKITKNKILLLGAGETVPDLPIRRNRPAGYLL